MARCTVYRSSRKEETYLFLAEDTQFEDLPEELQRTFGDPLRVMELDLGQTRRLARADPGEVRARLESVGYFLQLPPDLPVEELIRRRLAAGRDDE